MSASDSALGRRTKWPDPAYWVWRRLTSVRWAIGLILAAAAFSAVGVVIPQVPPQLIGFPDAVEQHIEAQRPTWGGFTDVLAEFPWFYETNGGIFNLYNQPYWFAVVVLVALAIAVCTVSRAPPIWRTVRRPPQRVNAAWFDRARHRYSLALPESQPTEASASELAQRLRRARYRVREVEEGEADGGAVLLFADRYGWAQLATFVTHIALLTLLGATLVTKFGGEEYQFWVAEGESRPLFAAGSERPQVQVIVDDAIARFDDDGRALDFRSVVRVAEGGAEVAAGEITVNGPLHAAGYRFHQAEYREHGAELRVWEFATGQLVYAETYFLEQQLVGPRVQIARGGALVSEEVLGLQHQVALPDGATVVEEARFANAAYTLIPLEGGRSLALTLIPPPAESERAGDPAAWQFWYRILPIPPEAANTGASSSLTPEQLGIDVEPSSAPSLRLVDAEGETLFDGVLTLDQAESESGGRPFALVDLPGGERIAVGFTASGAAGDDLFYFSFASETERGVLLPGGDATVHGVSLSYRGSAPDTSQQGSLALGETRRVGAIELSYLGPESVFFTLAEDVPGAAGPALVAQERFGQARTASDFDARGGDGVTLAVGSTGTSAGGQVGRRSRLTLGLGGGPPLLLEEGQEIVQGGYRYGYEGPREYTGLNVRRDPGGIAFWVGVGLGIAGMSVTFFLPRRRIWARITSDRIALAAQGGHGAPLSRELERLARGESVEIAPTDAPSRRRSRFSDDYRAGIGEAQSEETRRMRR